MNLRERKMRKLFVDCVGAPSVGEMIEGDFDDLNGGLIHRRHAVRADGNMRKGFTDRHAWTLADGVLGCKSVAKREPI